MTAGCEMCAGPPEPGHNFCEGCGRDLRATGSPDGAPVPEPAGTGAPSGGRELWSEDAAGPYWRSSRAAVGPCASCGSTEWDAEGYCENCGHRRFVGQEEMALELAGMAGITHKGQRKQRNEDAFALGRLGKVTAAVVCDGVSTSSRADEAAHAGVDAGMAALLASLDEGARPERAIGTATRAAAAAVAGLVTPDIAHSPPSCTYVVAVVAPTEVVIGSVGDSRAYWLADPAAEGQGSPAGAGSRHLTTDDAAPGGGALVRWLGADAGDTDPRVETFQPDGPGRVLLCSDGLSRYLSDPAELAVTAPGSPAETARALNQLSLDGGGVDNIAIVIMPFPPEEPS